MKRMISLVLYYMFAKYLPATDNGAFYTKWIQKIRYYAAKLAFDLCGKHVKI